MLDDYSMALTLNMIYLLIISGIGINLLIVRVYHVVEKYEYLTCFPW